jgi:hypothetical protein
MTRKLRQDNVIATGAGRNACNSQVGVGNRDYHQLIR